jgi:CheY-like chemotaxis protein
MKFSQGCRILIADDDKIYRSLLGYILQSSIPQAEIETVANGQDLVELLRCRRYDVVFTDNQMPNLLGHVAITTVRREGYNNPMYLVSGDDNLPDIAKKSGATGYIHKNSNLRGTISKIVTDLGLIE